MFKKIRIVLYIVLIITPFNSFAQDEKQQGHTNINKFRQLYDEFASPNIYRTASGAPGPAYYQQRADYKINVDWKYHKEHIDICKIILNTPLKSGKYNTNINTF